MERVLKKVKRSDEPAADLAYWLSRPMAERIAAVEVLRQQAFGEKAPSDAEQRLQRVCSVVRRVRTIPGNQYADVLGAGTHRDAGTRDSTAPTPPDTSLTKVTASP